MSFYNTHSYIHSYLPQHLWYECSNLFHLKFYKKIIEQACNYIENGYLILEIGYDQKEDVENLLKENKNYSEIKTIQDLSGNDRCVIAKVGKI